MPCGTSTFQTVPRIIFGMNAVKSVGEEARGLGAKRIAIVTDPGLVEAGVHEPVIDSIKRARLKGELFQDVEPDPRLEIVTEAMNFVLDSKANLVLGLGGGSSMDIAKAAAIMCTNPGPVQAYAGVNLVPRPGLPTILIPTTAGTGSEVTHISVLSDTRNQVKKGVVSNYMFARVALLDPNLTRGLPPHVTASTGLDALIHAIESYTGKQSTFMTEPLAHTAIHLIARYLRRAYADGSDLEARTGMLRASLLAGMAFANTQTAAAHACALALGGAYHIPHGVATSLMLPAVMAFNCIAAPEKFARIAMAFGEPVEGLPPMEAAEKSVKGVIRLIKDVGFQMGLENYGVSRSAVADLAKGAMMAARLWQNNPRSANQEQVEEIFRKSFSEQG